MLKKKPSPVTSDFFSFTLHEAQLFIPSVPNILEKSLLRPSGRYLNLLYSEICSQRNCSAITHFKFTNTLLIPKDSEGFFYDVSVALDTTDIIVLFLSR